MPPKKKDRHRRWTKICETIRTIYPTPLSNVPKCIDLGVKLLRVEIAQIYTTFWSLWTKKNSVERVIMNTKLIITFQNTIKSVQILSVKKCRYDFLEPVYKESESVRRATRNFARNTELLITFWNTKKKMQKLLRLEKAQIQLFGACEQREIQ